MSLLGALGNLIKKIFSKIFSFIKKIFKKFWWVLLILAVVWFAPAITTWLTTAGAPAWLTSATGWIATNVTPLLVSAGSWLWSGAGSLLTSAWTAYSSLGLGTQLAVLLGGAALLAPDETGELIDETVHFVGDVIEAGAGVVGDVVGSVLSSGPVLLVGAGLLAWWLLAGSGNDDDKRKLAERSRDQQRAPSDEQQSNDEYVDDITPRGAA